MRRIIIAVIIVIILALTVYLMLKTSNLIITESASKVANSSKDNHQVIFNEQSGGEKGLFYLGMTYKELSSLDLYNTEYQITSTQEMNEDNKAWNYGHKVVWTPKLSCLFDRDENLYQITVNGDLPTVKGLKNGDTTDVLDKLYGTSDKRYDFDWGYVLEYRIGDHFFFVSVKEGVINLWGVSKYRYDYVK